MADDGNAGRSKGWDYDALNGWDPSVHGANQDCTESAELRAYRRNKPSV